MRMLKSEALVETVNAALDSLEDFMRQVGPGAGGEENFEGKQDEAIMLALYRSAMKIRQQAFAACGERISLDAAGELD